MTPLLGFEFTDTLDPTAIATFVVALVAVVGLVLTRRSLMQTQSEIDLSRREVEEAHRPVVVPAAQSRPGVVSAGALAVPVANVGNGPALRVEASANLLDVEGKPSLAGGGEQTPAFVAGIGAGQTTTLEIKASWTTGVSFELTTVYEDLAGKRWQTVGRWLEERGRYEGLMIERGDHNATTQPATPIAS
jgi:hypothetical protein